MIFAKKISLYIKIEGQKGRWINEAKDHLLVQLTGLLFLLFSSYSTVPHLYKPQNLITFLSVHGKGYTSIFLFRIKMGTSLFVCVLLKERAILKRNICFGQLLFNFSPKDTKRVQF